MTGVRPVHPPPAPRDHGRTHLLPLLSVQQLCAAPSPATDLFGLAQLLLPSTLGPADSLLPTRAQGFLTCSSPGTCQQCRWARRRGEASAKWAPAQSGSPAIPQPGAGSHHRRWAVTQSIPVWVAGSPQLSRSQPKPVHGLCNLRHPAWALSSELS